MFHICTIYKCVCVKNGTHVYLGTATGVLAVFKERTTASNMIKRCLCTSQHLEGVAKDLIKCSLATMVCRKYCERQRYVCIRTHNMKKHLYNKRMFYPKFEIERNCLLKENITVYTYEPRKKLSYFPLKNLGYLIPGSL